MTHEPVAGPRVPDLLGLAWRISASAWTTLALCVFLAVTLVVAALIPQQPAGLSTAAAERWLAATIDRYGSLGPVLRWANAFNILSSTGFAVALAVCAYHLLVRLAAGAAAARRLLAGAPGLPPAGPAPCLVPLAVASDEAGRRVHELLAAHGYGPSATVLSTSRHTVFFAARRPLSVLGPLAAELGALLILAGFLVNASAGWTAPDVALAPGSTTPLAAGDGLQARLDGLTGSDRGPVATVWLARRDGQSRVVRVGAALPAAWGYLWLAQRSTGPALAASAEDGSGRPVLLQAQAEGGRAVPLLHVLFTDVQTEQVFAAPDHNIAFRVVNYPSLPGQQGGQPAFLVEAYRGSDSSPALNQMIQGRATLTLDGVTYTLLPERHVVLTVSYWPGLWLLVAGGILLLAGGMVALAWDQRSAWVSLVEEGSEVLALVRVVAWHGAGAERDRLAAALTPASPLPREQDR